MSTPGGARFLAAGIAAVALIVVNLQWRASGQATADAVHRDLQARFEAQVEPGLAGRSQFTFAVTGDIHLSPRDVRVLTRQTWQDLLGRWRDAGHLFGVVVGDLGFGEAQGIADVVDGWAAVPNAPPIYYTIGNHELDAPMGKRAWIDALYPGAVAPGSWTPTVLPAGNSDAAYWAFDVGPFWRFIMLDGDHRTPEGLGAMGTIGSAQLAWLAADLHANPGRHVMVFIHEPVDQPKYDTAEYTLLDRGLLLDVLAAHPKQKFLFSGHLHSYRGITKWRGITSVHTSEPGADGVRVAVDGETATVSWPGMTAADTVDYDQHPMYQVVSNGVTRTLRVGEENGDYGRTRTKRMTVVGAENGVTPRHGSLMLKAGPVTWYDQWFISEQLVKIVPGMKFSYDIWLSGVVNGLDAVVVQPNWVNADGSEPALVADQNGLALSRHTRDTRHSRYYADLPRLGGRATGQWYHREIDLTPLAGSYADGVSMAAAALNVNVGTVYVDNITFTWPAGIAGAPADTLAPFVSGLQVTEGAPGNVTVTWNTDEPATSHVDYGTTAAYGHSKSNSALVTGHSIALTGLAPNTVHHVRVRSRDLAANLTITGDETFTTGNGPPPVASTLAAHWPLDEGAGATATDVAGGRTATLVNGAGWAAGRIGAAVTFDGVNDYLDVPDVSTSGSALTIAAWVKHNGFPSAVHQRFVSKASGAAEQDHLWMLGQTSVAGANRLRFRLKAGGITTTLIAQVGDIPLNTWYHAAATYDGTVMRLYLDGALVGSIAKTGTVAADPAVRVNIGRNPEGSNYLLGSIDDVRLYTRGLSAGEIADVMTGTVAEVDTTPPDVSLTAPAPESTVGGTVSVTADATDNAAVSAVQFFVNGAPLGAPDTVAPFSVAWNTTGLSGPHMLTATATDAAGNSSPSDPVAVTVEAPPADVTPPTVILTAPAGGSAVSGTVTVTATATDNSGAVARVQFFAGGVPLGPADTFAPFAVSWDTTGLSGAHVLTATATDAAGNTGSSAPVTVTIAVAPPPDPTGLLAHWPMDEGVGTAAADVVGGRTGAFAGGAAWAAGRVGGAVGLNGATAYIGVPDVPITGNALTMTAWVTSSVLSTASHQRFVSKASGSGEQDHVWMLGHTIVNGAHRLRFRLKAGGTTTTLIASGGDLPLGTWYHAAATYDGATMRLYLNGALVGSVAKTGAIAANAAVPVNLGRNPDGTHYLTGAIDEVRIYNRALNGTELVELMSAGGEPGPPPPPVPDTTPPAVSISAPAGGSAVSGAVTVTADATDNSGTVARVQFFAGGVPLGAADTLAPFAATWDTSSLTGAHVLTATATDAAGNTASSPPVTVTIAVAPPPEQTGLLAHWPMNEGTGTTAADVVGGRTGTIVAGAAWATGQLGGAIGLNGTTAYVGVPDVPVSGSALTMTAWVTSSVLSTASHQRFISKATGAGEQDHVWMLGHTIVNGAHRLRFRLKAGGTTTTLIASGGELPVGSWYHAAATYDGATMRLYLNGALVGSVAKTGAIAANAAVPVNLGRNPDGTNYLAGALDDVRIYNRTLSTAEVQAVMTGAVVP